MIKNVDVLFFVAYPYYFPHFLPISQELEKQGMSFCYVLYEEQNVELMKMIADQEGVDYVVGEHNLKDISAQVIFFANVYNAAVKFEATTIFLCHGTGTKQCKFESALHIHDIVIVEGQYRYSKYKSMFPSLAHKLHKVGYSKLDPVVNISKEKKTVLQEYYQLDPQLKTLLYAPTFYPSSIGKMSCKFPADFPECNIIVKPHYLSLQRKSYQLQRKQFTTWATYQNCQIMDVEEYNLVPFLAIADVMISDESSAIFEFASLNKPVVINRFLKLRWSYYLNPGKLLQRMDSGIDQYRKIGSNPKSYVDMVTEVKLELDDTTRYEQNRLKLAGDICGQIDGKVSSRIVDIVRGICD